MQTKDEFQAAYQQLCLQVGDLYFAYETALGNVQALKRALDEGKAKRDEMNAAWQKLQEPAKGPVIVTTGDRPDAVAAPSA